MWPFGVTLFSRKWKLSQSARLKSSPIYYPPICTIPVTHCYQLLDNFPHPTLLSCFSFLSRIMAIRADQSKHGRISLSYPTASSRFPQGHINVIINFESKFTSNHWLFSHNQVVFVGPGIHQNIPIASLKFPPFSPWLLVDGMENVLAGYCSLSDMMGGGVIAT